MATNRPTIMGKYDIGTAAGRRAFFLDMLRRRARPGTGSTLAFLQSREHHSMPDLNSLFVGLRYVVVGGTATSLYMPWRFSKDVDILVAASDVRAVEEALRGSGAGFAGPLAIMNTDLGLEGNGWVLADGSSLDVLWGKGRWIDEALAHPNRDDAGLPIVSLPYLVLLKLDASRSQDFADLGKMLGGAKEEALDAVRAVVRKYLPNARDDLEGFIQYGRLEYQAALQKAHEVAETRESPPGEDEGNVQVAGKGRRARPTRAHTRRKPRR